MSKTKAGAVLTKEPGDLQGRTTPVDLLAFHNLMDPEQQKFLRSALATRDYRRLQRMRIRVAATYVKAVYTNAGILIRLGEA